MRKTTVARYTCQIPGILSHQTVYSASSGQQRAIDSHQLDSQNPRAAAYSHAALGSWF